MTIMQIKLVRTFAEEFSLNSLQTNLEDDEMVTFTVTAASTEASKRFFIGFNLELRVEEKNQFSVKYLAEFECDTDVTPDMLKGPFVQVNAPAIAYPFMRAFIATILLNAGYEPPMLPAVNFQMLYKQRQESKE